MFAQRAVYLLSHQPSPNFELRRQRDTESQTAYFKLGTYPTMTLNLLVLLLLYLLSAEIIGLQHHS